MRYYIIPFFIISFFLVNPQAYAQEKETSEIMKEITKKDMKFLTVFNALNHCGAEEQAEEIKDMYIETKIMSLMAAGVDIDTYKDLMMGVHGGFLSGYSVALSLEQVSENPRHSDEACRIASNMINDLAVEFEEMSNEIRN